MRPFILVEVLVIHHLCTAALLGLLLVGCRQTGAPCDPPASGAVAGAGPTAAATEVPVDAPGTAPGAQEPEPVFPRAPTPAGPVVAVGTVTTTTPGHVKPGEAFLLTIHVRIAPAWHIYAHDATGTANVATQLALELPAGIEALEEWQHPRAHSDRVTHVSVLDGTFAFRRKLRAGPSAAPGDRELVCEITYQACDPFMCRPPEQLTVRVPVRIE